MGIGSVKHSQSCNTIWEGHQGHELEKHAMMHTSRIHEHNKDMSGHYLLNNFITTANQSK